MIARLLHHNWLAFVIVLCLLLALLILVSAHLVIQGHLTMFAAIYTPDAMFPGH